ncbi:MAG: DNA polymerase III subunit beta [Planctomycetota bacterium]
MSALKVICDRSALLDAINLASGVVAARTPRPQLTCVKLVAHSGGDMTLAATDGEVSLRLTLSRVDVQQPGELLIPADKLRQIVSAEDAEPTLTLEADGDGCVIRGADARFTLHGYPAGDFPAIPAFQEMVAGAGGQPPARDVFQHHAAAIDELITRTLFATARENSRYAINGVLLRRDGKKLEMVATDGRRLALCRSQITELEMDAEPASAIIPSKALSLVQKLLGDDDETVEVALTDARAAFNIGVVDGGPARATLLTSLVEGAFPPFEDVIPKDQDIRVKFDRDVLASAVRRAALLTNEESRGVRMAFHGGDKQVELSSRAPQMGEAEVKVDLAGYEGDDVEIGFNPAFITDALKVINDPDVVLELKAGNKPGLLKSGGDFLYVVMPVNLQ